MITGAHITIASRDEEADMAFFRDVLKLPNVDASGGYVIFGLPPCEVAVHGGKGGHTLHLMCADMEAFLENMEALEIESSPPEKQIWGMMTTVSLPGGSKLTVYEPAHKHPKHPAAATKAERKTKSPARKKAVTRKTKKKARRR